MKEISLEERKQIQLQMMAEIDIFCRSHNIRYTLAYGTLIGAIRHNGFIPWDDDIDIMMPLPDMLKFKETFNSKTMRYCDVDTEPKYQLPFPRIVNTQTYNKEGLISKSYGISIDLYPVLGIPDTLEGVKVFFEEAQVKLKKRLSIIKFRSRMIKYLPLKNIIGFNNAMKRFRDFIYQYPYEGTKYYFTYGGELDFRNVINYDLFKELIDVKFEGQSFLATRQYHELLTHFYGDYMKLPPEDQQVPYHGGKYYWK